MDKMIIFDVIKFESGSCGNADSILTWGLESFYSEQFYYNKSSEGRVGFKDSMKVTSKGPKTNFWLAPKPQNL